MEVLGFIIFLMFFMLFLSIWNWIDINRLIEHHNDHIDKHNKRINKEEMINEEDE